jgi:hypothetical protein
MPQYTHLSIHKVHQLQLIGDGCVGRHLPTSSVMKGTDERCHKEHCIVIDQVVISKGCVLRHLKRNMWILVSRLAVVGGGCAWHVP